MNLREIEDLLLVDDTEAASKLINQLSEDQSSFKTVFKAEILRIDGNIDKSIELCDSIIYANTDENVTELHKFIARTIKAYDLYRDSKFEECDKVLIEAEMIHELLADVEKKEFIIWYAIFLQVKGNIQIEKGSTLDSMKNWEKAIEIYRKSKRVGRIPGLISNLGIRYSLLGQIEKGLEYLHEAEKMIDQDPNSKSNTKYFVKLQLGRTHTLKGDFTNAIRYLKESLDLAYEFNNFHFQHYSIGNLYYTYIEMGDRDQAKLYLDLTVDLLKEGDTAHYKPILDLFKAMYLQSSKKAKNMIEAQGLLENIVYKDQISIGVSNTATILLVEILLEELKSYGEQDVLNEIIHLTMRVEESAKITSSLVLSLQIMLLRSKFLLITGELVESNNLLDEAEELAIQHQINLYSKQIQTEKKRMRSEIHKWEEMIGRGASIKEKMDLINYQEYIDIAKKYVESV